MTGVQDHATAGPRAGLAITLDQVTVAHPAARTGAALALHALSLTVGAGERVAIIGPSGAGKTTLLHTMAAALQPTRGHLHLDAQDPWALSGAALHRLRSRLFLAPQTPPLPPGQRVVTAVLAARLPRMSLAASLRQLMQPKDAPDAFAALDAFDVGQKLWDRVDRLSGGERQRVGLARALVSPADLWLVDEPLSALDPTRADQALRTLVDAAGQRGATLVASLHQVELALAHFPRVIGLRDGRLGFDLPADQIAPAQLAALYAGQGTTPTGPRAASDAALTTPSAQSLPRC